jgi:hypothetical protein
LGSPFLFAQLSPGDWEDNWVLVKEQSSTVDVFGSVSLKITSATSERLQLTERWGTRRFQEDELELKVGGELNEVEIDHKVFPSNVFMGLRRKVGANRLITAHWNDGYTVLQIEETCPVIASQGHKDMRFSSTLQMNADASVLTWTLYRPTRPADEPIVYVLKREGYRDAYYMEMSDDWYIDGDLPEQAVNKRPSLPCRAS